MISSKIKTANGVTRIYQRRVVMYFGMKLFSKRVIEIGDNWIKTKAWEYE